MDSVKREKKKSPPVHGPPMQSRVVAANRAVLATCATILAPMAMNKGWGKCRTERGLVDMGSRHGMANVGRQVMAEQGRCRRTQPADEMAGTGLEANTDDPTGTGLAVNSQPMKLASLCLEMEVSGGSAMVLATQKAGSDLPNCLPPTCRLCLSLSIPTPLICKTQFSPNFFFSLPYWKSSPNPLYRPCSANLSCHLAYNPTPTFPSWRGMREGQHPVSRPYEASEWPPRSSAILSQSGSSGPQRERRDGWCRGVHFLIYPNH